MSEQESRIRSPIGVIMGHVDSGKTSLLDKVRRTAVQVREAGGITQHIGASFFPAETIEEMSSVLHKGSIQLKIPGILMVDTPGHAAFMNLRSRGASVADIAIVVVDLTRGLQAQTYESINTLKRRKVPFIIAANKVDRVGGWKGQDNLPFVASVKQQSSVAQAALDSKLYDIMGELGQMGFESDRYDRVTNFTKKVAIIPTSASTGEGIPDLFLVLSGLTQQFLMKRLETTDAPGKGVILEVKEEVGLGVTIDVILYDGCVFSDDIIVIGGKEGAIITKMRAMLEPKNLDEMRDPRDKFIKVKEAHAATGVKIIGPELKTAMSGSPFYVAEDMKAAKKLAKEIEAELATFKIATDEEGVIVRTDTLGSLEAFVGMLKELGIAIRSADVGDITKKDIIDASITLQKKPEYGAILNFNVKVADDVREFAMTEGVEIFEDPIIYGIVDKYQAWLANVQNQLKAEEEGKIKRPTKIALLPNLIFRRNKPAIVGVVILSGELAPGDVLVNVKNKRVGRIQQIRDGDENIKKAGKGLEVAVSIQGPTIGRQIQEEEELYVDLLPRQGLAIMTKYIETLTVDERQTFKEIELKKKKSGLNFWPYSG